MENVEGVTAALLSKALDAAQFRQAVIANNIANVSTDGYRPYRVDFASLLADLQTAAGDSVGTADAAAQRILALSPNNYAHVDETATRVQLDQEIVDMTQNTVQYQALLTANAKLNSIMKTAIRGGR